MIAITLLMTTIVVIEIWSHIISWCNLFLKIGSALAERVGQGGEVGGCHPLGDSAWRLLQLAVEKA